MVNPTLSIGEPKSKTPSSRLKGLLLIQLLWYLIIIVIAIGYYGLNLDRTFIVHSISIVIISWFIYSVWSWGISTQHFFDPYVLFLSAAMLFNGGQAIIEIFGIKPSPIFDVYLKLQPTTVVSALILVALGLLSFQSGGLIAAGHYLGSMTRRHFSGGGDSNHVRFALRLMGYLLLLISFWPLVSELRNTISVVMSGGYWATFQIDTATGFGALQRVISLFFVPGTLFLLAGSKGKPFHLVLSGLMMISYAAVEFFIGSRSSAIMPLLAYAWLWHKSIHSLPRVLLIVSGLIFLFVIFPVISLYRAMAGNIRIASPSLFVQTFDSIQNPLISGIAEMAFTLFTVGATLDLVPSTRVYALGSSYFYSLLGIVPNLFWKVHPTSANELATWLSWTVSSNYAAAGGGWGYSFIAEAYLNFGWIGMTGALMLMGFVFARFVLWASHSGSVSKMALLASFSSLFFLFARGESASIPRYFVWYSLLPYALVMFIAKAKWGSHQSS